MGAEVLDICGSAIVAAAKAHGATAMLVLLASRWLISIGGMISTGDAGTRSLWLNAIAFAGYLAGAAQFAILNGSDWVTETAGLFFALNLALILIDGALIVILRREARFIERRLTLRRTP